MSKISLYIIILKFVQISWPEQFRSMFLLSYKPHFIAWEHPSLKAAGIGIKLDWIPPHAFSEHCCQS